MKVSWNRCTPQSSILMAFSLINHRFLGTPIRTLPMKQPFWLPAPNLGHVQLTSQALGHGALPEQSLLGQLERSPVRPVILGLWYILPWNRPSFGEKMEVSSENYVQWRSLIFFTGIFHEINHPFWRNGRLLGGNGPSTGESMEVLWWLMMINDSE